MYLCSEAAPWGGGRQQRKRNRRQAEAGARTWGLRLLVVLLSLREKRGAGGLRRSGPCRRQPRTVGSRHSLASPRCHAPVGSSDPIPFIPRLSPLF